MTGGGGYMAELRNKAASKWRDKLEANHEAIMALMVGIVSMEFKVGADIGANLEKFVADIHTKATQCREEYQLEVPMPASTMATGDSGDSSPAVDHEADVGWQRGLTEREFCGEGERATIETAYERMKNLVELEAMYNEVARMRGMVESNASPDNAGRLGGALKDNLRTAEEVVMQAHKVFAFLSLGAWRSRFEFVCNDMDSTDATEAHLSGQVAKYCNISVLSLMKKVNRLKQANHPSIAREAAKIPQVFQMYADMLRPEDEDDEPLLWVPEAEVDPMLAKLQQFLAS